MGLGALGLGFFMALIEPWGLGFGVLHGLGFRVLYGFGPWGLGFRVLYGFRPWGFVWGRFRGLGR